MYTRLSSRVRAIHIWLMAPLLGLSLFMVVLVSFMAPVVQAATSSNLNFQARLLNSSGGVVPDGTYNIDFKIYNADSTTGSVGTCSSACLWEETRKVFNSQGVTVINGYFSVNLGSVTSFPAINWDQQLWLTMNIGGTSSGASPTWDGEMQNAGHSVALTAIPYSFIAGQLAKTSGAHRGTLAFNTVANDPAILLPDASGTVCLQNASACGFESTTGNDFIQNQSASPQSANFDISGSGFIGTGLQVPLIQTADSNVANTAALVLRSGNETGTSLSSGNVTIKSGDAGSGSSSSSGNISIDAGTKSAGGATGSISIGTTNASAVSIGNSTAALTLTGSSSSSFVLNGITISAAELNLLDGHGNAGSTLVDTNDAVTTAIIGTGALDAGSITSNFGSIDTGADNITTTGAVSGNSFDRTTSGTLSVGTGQASAITLGGSSTVTTAAGGLTVTSGKNFTVNGDVFTDLTGTGLVDSSNALSIDQSASLTWTGLEAISNNNALGFIVSDSSSSKAVLTVDTSGDAVILGKAGASGLTGKLTFQNAANANALSIQAGTTTSGYTLTLPTALPGSTQCLQSDNAGVLSFTTCLTSAAVTTIGTYSSSNHYSNGATISGSTLTLGSADATRPGLVDTSAQTFAGDKTLTGNTVLNGSVLAANTADSTAAFQVQDSTTAALFNVNTSDGYTIDNGTAAVGNVIENPSFESSGTTSGTGWYTPSASQVITVSSANAHSGNNELQITGNSNTHAVTTKYFAVHPGDTIYIEAYVKNSGGANGDGGIYLEFSDKDKGNATFSNSDTGLPGTSYVLKSITATVPASKFFVRMAASVKATSTTGTFYFDDFYLKKANEQAPLLITNASATAFQVQNASSQTVLGVDTSSSKIFTTIPDSGSAIGFTFNTPSYTSSGAKLLSLQNNSVEKFYVDKDGNIVNQGNITASGNMNIGAGKQYQINGTPLASTNLSDTAQLAYLAGTGPQTFSGNNKFTGTVLSQTTSATAFQVQNATNTIFAVDASGNKTILGTGGGSGLTGVAQFNYSGSSGSITIAPLDPSSTAYTLSLPAENGTLCTSAASSTANCTNFASSSSLTSGLAGKLNKNATDTSAAAAGAASNLYAFTNNSSGVASGVLKLNNNNNTDNALYVTGTTDYATGKAYILVNNTNGTPSGNLIDLQSNAVDQFTVDASGNVVAAGNISIATGKVYEINGVQITSAALNNDFDLAKLAANQTFAGDNTFSSASNSFTGNGANLSSLNAANISSGLLSDSRLSNNVAFRNQDNTFASTNTFSPTANNVGTTINQTSGTATSGSVLDVQAVGGAHFLQITNAASGEGAVTLQSVGATRDLTLNSASGTLKLGSATTILQKAASSFTIDLANAGTSTLILSNSNGSNVASLSVTGDIGVASGRAFKVGATAGVSIGTCGATSYVSSFLSSGGIVTGGTCTALSASGDNITVNSSAATDANFIDVSSTSAIAGTSWTLAGASPSNISVAVANATNTTAGAVTAGTQTIGGDKTLSGVTTFSNATTNLNSSTVATSAATITLFNTNATNVTAFGAGTTIAIGATTGTITLKNANTTLGNAAGSGVLTNNGATLNSTLAVLDDSDGGALGGTPGTPLTAAQSVDIYTSISVAQTTAGQTITLPTPTASTAYGRLLYLSNIGTVSFIVGNVTIGPGQSGTLVWSNTNGAASWQYAGAGADSIANQTSIDQTANFRISGTGRANTSFTSPVFDSISGALGVGSVNATSITVGNTGTTPTTSILLQTKGAGTTVKTATDVANAFVVQNSNSRSLFAVDTSTGLVSVGNTTDGAQITLAATGNASGTIRKSMIVTGTIAANDLVEIDTTNAGQVQQAVANSTKVFGVASSAVGSGSAQDIVIGGVYQVNANSSGGTIAIGDTLVSSSTVGQATKSGTTTSSGSVVGLALSTISSGKVWVYINLGLGGSDNLQTVYNKSTGGTTPELKVDSTRGGLDIQDADSALNSSLLTVRNSNSGGLGSAIFDVQSANPITDVTNNANNNLVTNGSFEVNVTGWAAKGSASAPVQNSTFKYIGGASSKIVTTAASNDGTSYNVTLSDSTAYTLVFSLRLDPSSTAFATLAAGYNNGSSDSNCTLSSTTVSASGWTTFSCSFTTASSHSGTPAIYIKQTDANIHTFYLDAVQLSRYSILSNASAEVAFTASDWQKKTGSETSVTQVSTQQQDGSNSVQVVTTGSTQGTKHNETLNDSTQYNLTFYAKASGSNFSTMEAGYNDGSSNIVCITAQTVVTTGWTAYSCVFTTTSSHSGTPYFYVDQTDATGRTFFLDNFQLSIGTASGAYREGKIALNGTITSPISVQNQSDSTTAFQVQNASGTNVMVLDSLNKQLKIYENGGSTNYALIYYDTATTTANYTASGGTVAVGTGAGAITITSGASGAINITGNAASTWKTNTGTLTVQSGSSSDLILNPGSSIVSINGSSVVKLGSSAGDPGTCTLGAIVYNSTTNLFRGCQGSSPAWATLSSTTQTAQQAYTASTGSTTPEIKLDSTRNGFDIQDADTGSGSPLGVLFAVRGTNNAGLGTSIFNVNSSNSTVNIGTSAASTALLVLGSDTDSTFNQGTASNAASTVVNGAMFYSSTDHNFLCGQAGSWLSCNGLLYSNTASSTAINTCTTACAAFSKAAPIPANYCQAGRTIHIIARGIYGLQNVASQTYALGVYYGTDSSVKTNDVLLGTSTSTTALTNLTNNGWKLDTTIICYDTTHMQAEGDFTYSISNTAATAGQTVLQTDTATTGTSVTTTSAKTIYLYPAFGASNSANTATLQQLIVTGN